jgi:hypothetical protein
MAALLAGLPREAIMALAYPRILPLDVASASRSVESGLATDWSRYLLVLRFALLNLTAFGLVGIAWAFGWLGQMIATDKFHLIKLNVGVFLVGLAICAARIAKVSRELNELRTGQYTAESRVGRYLARIRALEPVSRLMLAESLKMKFGVRLGDIRHIATAIVLIGLIGTVIGFIVALSGVDAEAATETSAIAPMVSTLLLGMAIALYKTLVGSALNLWLTMNLRLLEAGSVHLVTSLIDEGEADARA